MSLDRYCRIEESQIIVEGIGTSEEVDFARCDTHAKILAWVAYFLERPAFEPATIRRFIRLACEQHKLSIQMA